MGARSPAALVVRTYLVFKARPRLSVDGAAGGRRGRDHRRLEDGLLRQSFYRRCNFCLHFDHDGGVTPGAAHRELRATGKLSSVEQWLMALRTMTHSVFHHKLKRNLAKFNWFIII